MEIFTKLLVINIVTNKVFGFCLISTTSLSLRLDEDSSSLMSLGCNEKYAVSLDDANAEQRSITHMIIKQITTLADMPIKKGSADEAVNKHIRGSIEDSSKMIIFTIQFAKIQKKTKG